MSVVHETMKKLLKCLVKVILIGCVCSHGFPNRQFFGGPPPLPYFGNRGFYPPNVISSAPRPTPQFLYKNEGLEPPPVLYRSEAIQPSPMIFRNEAIQPGPPLFRGENLPPVSVLYHQDGPAGPNLYRQGSQPGPDSYPQDNQPEPNFYREEGPAIYRDKPIPPRPVLYRDESFQPEPEFYHEQGFHPSATYYDDEPIQPQPHVSQDSPEFFASERRIPCNNYVDQNQVKPLFTQTQSGKDCEPSAVKPLKMNIEPTKENFNTLRTALRMPVQLPGSLTQEKKVLPTLIIKENYSPASSLCNKKKCNENNSKEDSDDYTDEEEIQAPLKPTMGNYPFQYFEPIKFCNNNGVIVATAASAPCSPGIESDSTITFLRSPITVLPSRFPPRIEQIIERIQTYFSTYNHQEHQKPSINTASTATTNASPTTSAFAGATASVTAGATQGTPASVSQAGPTITQPISATMQQTATIQQTPKAPTIPTGSVTSHTPTIAINEQVAITEASAEGPFVTTSAEQGVSSVVPQPSATTQSKNDDCNDCGQDKSGSSDKGGCDSCEQDEDKSSKEGGCDKCEEGKPSNGSTPNSSVENVSVAVSTTATAETRVPEITTGMTGAGEARTGPESKEASTEGCDKCEEENSQNSQKKRLK